MSQKTKYDVGDICLCGALDGDGSGLADAGLNFLYNKRILVWNHYNTLPNQLGCILQVLSVKETINLYYQKYYQGSDWQPYLWYCFKTAQVYLVYHKEMKDK